MKVIGDTVDLEAGGFVIGIDANSADIHWFGQALVFAKATTDKSEGMQDKLMKPIDDSGSAFPFALISLPTAHRQGTRRALRPESAILRFPQESCEA